MKTWLIEAIVQMIDGYTCRRPSGMKRERSLRRRTMMLRAETQDEAIETAMKEIRSNPDVSIVIAIDAEEMSY